jgi:VIT1/CCC1 family predicted Fe2+/Mn2+ transporter
MSGQSMSLPVDHDEPHDGNLASRLNWLRAGVLGANDGIVSVAAIVVGVAGATSSLRTILTAGLAGLFAGAMSMAAGEYVSVSSQRDTERAMLEMERRELAETPEAELEELTEIYARKGLSPQLASDVARELTAHDALAAHADAELGIDPDQLSNPWQAALASFVAFTVGAVLPLLAIGLPPQGWRIPVTFAAVVAALALTGVISARLGAAPLWPAIRRNVVGGVLAMVVTYLVGRGAGSFGA